MGYNACSGQEVWCNMVWSRYLLACQLCVPRLTATPPLSTEDCNYHWRCKIFQWCFTEGTIPSIPQGRNRVPMPLSIGYIEGEQDSFHLLLLVLAALIYFLHPWFYIRFDPTNLGRIPRQQMTWETFCKRARTHGW